MKTVMCFGTFDLLHLGHIDYFQQAKKYGDYLIVVIARDKTKEKQRKASVFSEQERLTLIQNLKIVDKVVLGNVDDHYAVIEEYLPNILCLGYDHPVDEGVLLQQLNQRGLHLDIKRMKPYKSENHKSSKMKEIILNSSS
ncbi:MAG: adenylyltransferase/cytidyltransferase family protein [Nanoarchaeota archaeon]|nr:adenylyltransferase/cytidyltransferase family protein [Nanoarchaeota archaeon]